MRGGESQGENRNGEEMTVEGRDEEMRRKGLITIKSYGNVECDARLKGD
jgi:hypothetical protein